MAKNNGMTPRLLARFFAAGIFVSMISVYLLHYFGTWEAGSYRRGAETTSSVIVTNKCALLDSTHVLWPGALYTNKESVTELKLAGSFLNFFDGHVVLMIILAFVFALILFAIKKAGRSPSPAGSHTIRSVS